MEKRGKLERDAQIMIKMLPQQVEHEKKLRASINSGKTPSKNSNPFEVKLSKALSFDFTEKEGRFAKVNRKVKVGEEVLVEHPICATLMEQFSKTHCQNCFAR